MRGSRSAGRIFAWQGAFYRPSQDCSKTYGYAIVVQKIRTINEREYAEDEAFEIFPNWYRKIIGTHTLNHVGGLTIIDGQRQVWR